MCQCVQKQTGSFVLVLVMFIQFMHSLASPWQHSIPAATSARLTNQRVRDPEVRIPILYYYLTATATATTVTTITTVTTTSTTTTRYHARSCFAADLVPLVMIRTHLPRGYIWSAASEFQRTEHFRDIVYEDAESIDHERLLPDSEDEFPLSERILKRQKIEQLASDFLDGEELSILSARLDATALVDALSWSFDRPKEVIQAIADADWDEGSQESWQDVDDDWDFLRKHCATRGIAHRHDDGMQDVVGPPSIDEEEEEEEVVVEARQSSCRRRKSQRLARISFGPSAAALRKAADLRNRKLRAAASNAVESIPQSCPRKIVENSQFEPESTISAEQDTLSDCGPSPTPAWTSAMWRSKGAFRPPRRPRPVLKAVDQDCSRDELGWSSFNSIPSHSARTRSAARIVAEREAGTQNSQNAAVTALISSAESVSSPVTESASRHCRDRDAVSTIEEQSGDASEQALAQSGYLAVPAVLESSGSQGDSQTRLLEQQGVLAKPRKSWATVNHGQVIPIEQEAIPPRAIPGDATKDGSPPRTRASILQSAKLNAIKPRKARTAKSAGGTPMATVSQVKRRSDRRRSAPSESQTAADALQDLASDEQSHVSITRMQYNESAPAKNSSPFVFRKRTAKFENSSDEPGLEPVMPQKVPATVAAPAKALAKTPRRAVNFQSSDVNENCQDPRTPLVNEHINQLLPRNSTTGPRSRSLRSSLRQEMIASGAELSRADGDQSSQPQTTGSPGAEESLGEETVLAESFMEEDNTRNISILADSPQPGPDVQQQQQVWPGTQAMLAQAQHELFTSPNKSDSALYLGDKSTPQVQFKNATGRRRRPLGGLSQEPMPSTQALLQDWQGWSSIKKPRQPGKRVSIVQSPTVDKYAPDLIASQPVQSFEDKARRRSSLRFSMSFSQDSPVRDWTDGPAPGAAQSTALVPASFAEPNVASWPKPSGKVASSASFESSLLPIAVAARAQSATELNEAATTLVVPPLMDDDGTTVNRSFGVTPAAPVQSKQPDATPTAVDSNAAPQSSPKSMSFRRSPVPVEVPQPFIECEESLVGELSFGAPDVMGGDDFAASMPSYLMVQNAQAVDFTTEYDTQELMTTIGELAEDILGTAATISF